MNAQNMKKMLDEFNQVKQEENYLKRYDVYANKLREDMAFDSFKKQTIDKQVRASMSVKEKRLN
jgi:hypothetical protein